MSPIVTIDGAPAPVGFAMWVEHSHALVRAHNGCHVCTSALYRGKPHAARCPTRAIAEALFGLLEAWS